MKTPASHIDAFLRSLADLPPEKATAAKRSALARIAQTMRANPKAGGRPPIETYCQICGDRLPSARAARSHCAKSRR